MSKLPAWAAKKRCNSRKEWKTALWLYTQRQIVFCVQSLYFCGFARMTYIFQFFGNIIAVREGNESAEKIKALVEVLQSDPIIDYIQNTYDGVYCAAGV